MKLIKLVLSCLLYVVLPLYGMEAPLIDLPALDTEQVKLALQILIERGAEAECLFAALAEEKYFEQNSPELLADLIGHTANLQEFEQLASSELKDFLKKFDERLLELNEFSYPQTKEMAILYTEMKNFSKLTEQFHHLARSFFSQVNALNKKSINGCSILGSAAKEIKRLTKIVKQVPSHETEANLYHFNILQAYLVEATQTIKQNLINQQDLSPEVLKAYYDLLHLKLITSCLIKKAEALSAAQSKISFKGSNPRDHLFKIYLSSVNNAQLNQQLYTKLLLLLPEHEQTPFKSIILYPAHYAQNFDKKRKQVLFRSLKALLHNSSLNVLAVELDSYVKKLMTELPYFKIQKERIANLLAEIKKLSQSGSQIQSDELNQKKAAFRRLLENNQEDEKNFHYAIVLACNKKSLLTEIEKICMEQLDLNWLSSISTSLAPLGFDSYVKEFERTHDLHRKSCNILFNKRLIPYFAEFLKYLNRNQAPKLRFKLGAEELKELREIAHSCLQTLEHPQAVKIAKSERRNARKPRNKNRERSNTVVPEPEVAEKAQYAEQQLPEQKKEPINKRLDTPLTRPVKKPKVTLSWRDFMKLCETSSNTYAPIIHVEYESDQMIMLRQWRGFTTEEEVSLLLYPVAMTARSTDPSCFCIDINTTNLPKMKDTLDTSWDTYHCFSTEIESKYLPSCAFVVEYNSDFAHEYAINLRADQYALCVRAKFLSGQRRYDPEYALNNKNNRSLGTDGHIVYIIDKRTHECVHRFFHRLES